MSDANLKSFVEAVAKDAELQSAWNEVASDARGLVALAGRQGFEITEDELREGLAAMRSADDELDDGELERVAGGLSIGAATPLGKKVQFFEGWPCKWTVPNYSQDSSFRRKI